MTKIFTDIKQSQKLIELGIDVNTADIHYMYRHWEIDENTIGSQSDASIGFDSDFYYGADNGKTYHYIPAWSLSALMHLMPTHYVVEKCSDSYCCYNFSVKEFFASTAVDAAFEMVCWLKENKKI